MSISRYKKQMPIVVLLIVMIILTAIASLFTTDTSSFLLINPANNAMLHSLLITAVLFVCVLLGSYIGGYLLGPLFLVAHRKTIGRA